MLIFFGLNKKLLKNNHFSKKTTLKLQIRAFVYKCVLDLHKYFLLNHISPFRPSLPPQKRKNRLVQGLSLKLNRVWVFRKTWTQWGAL